ncbi:MAG: NAD(P)-dependent oxidoreductase [Planctomycetes bacterium]|nr:NAD(P)-dependent oxidoreductase [Planctomycetota bacterium]
MKPVGIVGLGLVGRAMAARLIAAGHPVYGYDIASGACDAAASISVRVLEDASAVARAAGVVFLSLMTSEDRRILLWGPQQFVAAIVPGSVVLDTTTADPADIVEDAARLSEQGVRLIDVCLSGSSAVIASGQALALVGGSESTADYVWAVTPFTKKQFYFNAPGAGKRAKLIVNLVFGLNRLVLAEALGLARSGEFDPATILEVLQSGETCSVAMDTKGPKMIAGVYEPAVARLAQHAKDVHLIRDYAHVVGAATPLSDLHVELIDALVAQGFGDLDNAAIFKAYEG